MTAVNALKLDGRALIIMAISKLSLIVSSASLSCVATVSALTMKSVIDSVVPSLSDVSSVYNVIILGLPFGW